MVGILSKQLLADSLGVCQCESVLGHLNGHKNVSGTNSSRDYRKCQCQWKQTLL